MRNISKTLIAAAVVLAIGIQQQAEANLLNAPQALRGAIHRIKFDAPTLAPMAFTMFCIKYADECKPQHKVMFRGGRVKLTGERWAELQNVNRNVNAAIRPERNLEGLAGEKWLIGPTRGDCNDYAVTKRHELIAMGWPARSVLLSEVVVPSGEHHLVVVVRTNAGDLVLDNLTASITPWQRKPYQWVRIQMPKNPNYWAALADRNA
jgi:predicted transglutaminase-like cysteine proteinase